MKTTLLPLGLGLAAWFLLAVMVGVTFESRPARATPPAAQVTPPSPAPRLLPPR